MNRDYHDLYILKGKKPVPARDARAWQKWFMKANRRVALARCGNLLVSTMFLGINDNPFAGKPLLFETMVLDVRKLARGGRAIYKDQASTWAQAEAMHRRGVEQARALTGKNTRAIKRNHPKPKKRRTGSTKHANPRLIVPTSEKIIAQGLKLGLVRRGRQTADGTAYRLTPKGRRTLAKVLG